MTLLNKKRLVLMCGLPRSGKSTYVKKYLNKDLLQAPVVCPDAVRLVLTGQRFDPTQEARVWRYVRAMVESLFMAGHKEIILDATNVTVARRNEWISKDNKWLRTIHVLNTSVATCKERAIATDQKDLLPVIDRMAEKFVMPSLTEASDIDEINVVSNFIIL